MDEQPAARTGTMMLAFGTLGIVFGDIGTSPIYAVELFVNNLLLIPFLFVDIAFLVANMPKNPAWCWCPRPG